MKLPSIHCIYTVHDIPISLCIFGAGDAGRDVYLTVKNCFNHIRLAGVVDNKRNRIKGLEVLGEIVDYVQTIKNVEFDYIVISVKDENMQEQMLQNLVDIGIDIKKVLRYEPVLPEQVQVNKTEEQRFFQKRKKMVFDRGDKNAEELRDRELHYLLERIKTVGYYYWREWYLNKEHTCAYLNIPKAAGSSITKSVCQIEAMNRIHYHARGLCYHSKLPDDFSGYRFTFVRNPISRIRSCYLSKVKGRKYSEFYEYGYVIRGLERDHGFEMFVNTICDIPDGLADPHFLQQSKIVYQDGLKLVDDIGYVENLPQEFERIRQQYGLEKLERINRSHLGSESLLFKNELIEKFYQRYQEDFGLFQYDKL